MNDRITENTIESPPEQKPIVKALLSELMQHHVQPPNHRSINQSPPHATTKFS